MTGLLLLDSLLFVYSCIHVFLCFNLSNSQVEIGHAISAVEKGPQAGCLSLFNPLVKELVAVGVLSISAYHAPTLLS